MVPGQWIHICLDRDGGVKVCTLQCAGIRSPTIPFMVINSHFRLSLGSIKFGKTATFLRHVILAHKYVDKFEKVDVMAGPGSLAPLGRSLRRGVKLGFRGTTGEGDSREKHEKGVTAFSISRPAQFPYM